VEQGVYHNATTTTTTTSNNNKYSIYSNRSLFHNRA